MRFTDFVFAAVIAVIFVAIIIKIHGYRFFDKKRKYHPVAGTVIHQLFNFHRLLEYMVDLTIQRKTYRLLSFIRSEVYTANPANIQHILATNFPNYGKGWYHYSVMSDFLGDSIFTVDGEKWRHHRKTSSYQFSTKMLRDFSSSAFKSNAVKLAGVVSDAAISNNVIEMQDLFMKSTLDSVCKVILGVELDTMCGTYKEGTEFSNAFDEVSAAIMYRYFNFLWKIMRFLNIGSEAVLRNGLRVIDEFVYNLIRKKIEEIQKLQDNSTVMKGDILSRFIELKETDPKYLRDISLSFILAGKDTTAITLSWFLYQLCKHPRVQEKIAQEIREATNVAAGSTIDELAASVTEENMEKMQYLHAALNETLRLHPAVPVEGKFCFADDTWPDGFSVRKGDLISFQPYVMGRMKFLWGDDAEKFRPERWLDENGILKKESPYKFTAFQGGPRICLGKEFAYRQMKIYSTVLLGSHSFKLADQNGSVKYKTMLTLQIDGGMHVYASQRQN
ncbi:cytochrome P450 704C1 [Cajanus cajan]|uniref:Cytochrome P450 704C1 family n=1 Tax=Cajanus cajan TaxID=3821 RepID=A0A151QN64_CAJCA|nr:cytochrome P450 704C1 [Cajanus cajan]KYP31747.1 Cytochrome P450 704C1 family [Cajanus cajan]